MTTEDKLDIQTVKDEILTQSHSKIFNTPIFILVFVTSQIFIAEIFVTFILAYLSPMSIFSEALLDSLMLIILILPLLYRFLLRPLKLHLTELKRLEKKREQLLTELAQKNRELEQIVNVTSHDLRIPLVNIDGYTKIIGESLDKVISILDSDRVSAEVKEEIASIVEKDIPEAEKFISRSVVKMESLLSGLLQISRIGRLEHKEVKIDMNKMISVIHDTSKFQIDKAGVNLEITELPSCKGDETQINQLFSNLIDNALKYLDPARLGVIKISGHKENGSSVYCVEDNGIGIKPEHQGKIFEIFHQLEPRKAEGEGLGLTIVNKVVERHNGKIWVESELGKGSKFFVSLQRA